MPAPDTTNALDTTNDDASSPAKPRLRGVSHEIAAFVFPFLGLALVALADTASVRWSLVVYTVGLTLMYATSACYHRGHWSGRTRLRLRRLDHSMIMVAIASTYTPIAVAGLDGHRARVLLSVVWSLAVVGVALQLVWLHAPRWLVAALYIAIGWTAVAFAPALWRQLGIVTFSLLVLGGVVYSVGAAVYATQRPDPSPEVFGFHEVFHLLVIVAGLAFFAAIARVVTA
ncbi:MAG TPA: hemolysin III family protein [Acidimicrobiia bacterium]|nr:hemolysin III family protein [Acidimicrobiia bacterium]